MKFGGDLTGTNCFTSSTVRRALPGMAGVHVKAGGPGSGPRGCLEGGVAIGDERSGNGSDGGDFGHLDNSVGVGGGAPCGFGLGPHGSGNGEGDGGTFADCCWGCVCSGGCTAESEASAHAGDCRSSISTEALTDHDIGSSSRQGNACLPSGLWPS